MSNPTRVEDALLVCLLQAEGRVRDWSRHRGCSDLRSERRNLRSERRRTSQGSQGGLSRSVNLKVCKPSTLLIRLISSQIHVVARARRFTDEDHLHLAKSLAPHADQPHVGY